MLVFVKNFLLRFFKPSASVPQVPTSSIPTSTIPLAPNSPVIKPAIALITYCRADYFEQVFNSIQAQQINGRPYSDFFDLFVFQDGLLTSATPEQGQGHQAIADLCKSQLDEEHFIPQPRNLGVALHFDFVERALFEKQDRPWVAFCEDDLVLAPGYLETLSCMAHSFKDDLRVAMFSSFGESFNQSLDTQEARQNELTSMAHHWGFGMHQSAWRKRQPLVDEYLKLLNDIPYHLREHGRIQNWHAFCGFKPGSTSQDYGKACSIAAQGAIKVSSFANFGSYIGEFGLHFTPEIYAKKGYGKSYVFPSAITQPFELSEETYQRLLKQQQGLTIPSPP
jgi:hypothetical protein